LSLRLARYTPQHFLTLVERHGIRYHEKTLGQLFCDESSQQIIDMLKAECDLGNVEWRMPCEWQQWRRATALSRLRQRRQVRVVIACHCDRRADGFEDRRHALRLSHRRAVRLEVVPPSRLSFPLLRAETLTRFGDLSGIALDAEVSCNGGRFREQLSSPIEIVRSRDPAISSYWNGANYRHRFAARSRCTGMAGVAAESRAGSTACWRSAAKRFGAAVVQTRGWHAHHQNSPQKVHGAAESLCRCARTTLGTLGY